MSENTDYLDDLIFELRMLDVPGDRIGQIMAEAENHLAESGETGPEAFGPARAYASQLASVEGYAPQDKDSQGIWRVLVDGVTARDVLIGVAAFLLCGVGAAALLNGAFALIWEVRTWFGFNPWVLVAGGAALLACFLFFVKFLSDPIVDPRSGRTVDFDRHGHRKPSA